MEVYPPLVLMPCAGLLTDRMGNGRGMGGGAAGIQRKRALLDRDGELSALALFKEHPAFHHMRPLKLDTS